MDSAFEFEDLLTVYCSLIVEEVNKVAFSPDPNKPHLVLVLSNSDIVCWNVADHKEKQTIKWIPWSKDPEQKIKAISFQPRSLGPMPEYFYELLIITQDCCIYTFPTESLMKDGSIKDHCLKYQIQPPTPAFNPTAVVWWNTCHLREKDLAIVGGSEGEILFFSLSTDQVVAFFNTSSKIPIYSLETCYDLSSAFVHLLITNDFREQWKLLLEKNLHGLSDILIPFEDQKFDKPDLFIPRRSRMQEFKQKSMETFAMIKHKFSDTRSRHSSERSRAGSSKDDKNASVVFEECDCNGEAFISVQHYKGRRVLTGFFIPQSTLLIYIPNQSSTSLKHHKFNISPLVTNLLVTDTFMYVADIRHSQHRILVFSTHFSECSQDEYTEYNPASFVQSFIFPENEQIIKLFKFTADLPFGEKLEKLLSSPSNSGKDKLSRCNYKRQMDTKWHDGCLVVTNKAVYRIYLIKNLWDISVEIILINHMYIEPVTSIFGIGVSPTVELIVDILIQDNKFENAFALCKIFKTLPLKIAVKLAAHGYTDQLLSLTTVVLNEQSSEMATSEKINLSSYVVMCYAEKCLSDLDNQAVVDNFTNFLKNNQSYDEDPCMQLLAQHKLCKFVYLIAKRRGLVVEGSTCVSFMINLNEKSEIKTLLHCEDFGLLLSESSLTDGFILGAKSAHFHMYFVKSNINIFSKEILRRLHRFYDPSHPVLKPAMFRMLQLKIDKYLEYYDVENDKWGEEACMYDWVTVFILIHLNLYEKTQFEHILRKYVSDTIFPAVSPEFASSEKLVELQGAYENSVLSAGHEHAALVSNGSAIVWGNTAFGALECFMNLMAEVENKLATSKTSIGCVSRTTSMPTLLLSFECHRIIVRSVACGRHHTMALTNLGVYTWGSSKFGQLGIGETGQSVWPRYVDAFRHNIIVFVAAGQYHSLAIDYKGRLWTWGWGIYGQLGHGNIDDQQYPKCVERLEQKVLISAYGGQAHTIALSRKGRIYTFGCGSYGQLGIGTTSKSSVPIKLSVIRENVTLITTGYFYNLAVSVNNRLYIWGCSPQVLRSQAQAYKRSRQMAENSDSCNSVELDSAEDGAEEKLPPLPPSPAMFENQKHLCPTLIDTTSINGKIIQISCGLFHSAILTDTSKVYTWGRNTEGQLGNYRRQEDIREPSIVEVIPSGTVGLSRFQDRSLRQISCGRDFTIAVESNGRLHGWGNNSRRQLGIATNEENTGRKSLHGKAFFHKSKKRVLKTSNSSSNIHENPVEIEPLPNTNFTKNKMNGYVDFYSQLICKLELPGFTNAAYPVENICDLLESNNTEDRVLHYCLEVFHKYYNDDCVTRMCLEKHNYQAVSKICLMNSKYFESFFYSIKAFQQHVRKHIEDDDFKVGCELDMSKELKDEISTVECTNTEFSYNFEILTEMLMIYEEFLIRRDFDDTFGLFLQRSISAWIKWKLPIAALEWLFTKHFDKIGYNLALLLFCNNHKVAGKKMDMKLETIDESPSFSVPNGAVEGVAHTSLQRRQYRSRYRPTDFFGHESTTSNPRLYDEGAVVHECDDPDYRLNPKEIFQQFSVKFLIQLCQHVLEQLEEENSFDCDELVKLLHEILHAPSILKSDERSTDEVIDSFLPVLEQKKPTDGIRKFIQVSFEELSNDMGDHIAAFSCGHHYASKTAFEQDIEFGQQKLRDMNLTNTGLLMQQIFSSNEDHENCCPKCILDYIVKSLLPQGIPESG